MLGRSLKAKTRHSLWVALGFLCCALVAATGAIQLAHTHSDGQAVQSDCALCHTAHLVVQPSIPQSLPRTVWLVATLSAVLQPILPSHFTVFSLFTRPPPVDAAFA